MGLQHGDGCFFFLCVATTYSSVVLINTWWAVLAEGSRLSASEGGKAGRERQEEERREGGEGGGEGGGRHRSQHSLVQNPVYITTTGLREPDKMLLWCLVASGGAIYFKYKLVDAIDV